MKPAAAEPVQQQPKIVPAPAPKKVEKEKPIEKEVPPAAPKNPPAIFPSDEPVNQPAKPSIFPEEDPQNQKVKEPLNKTGKLEIIIPEDNYKKPEPMPVQPIQEEVPKEENPPEIVAFEDKVEDKEDEFEAMRKA